MKKSFMVLFLAFLIVGLISASAFAAAQLNVWNTTLAAEKISPTTDYPASSVNTAYQTGGPVPASTVIKISLTNGKFTAGSTIYICNGSTSMGNSDTLSSDSNYVEIPLDRPLASGTVYTFQPNACTGTSLNNVRVPAGSVAGTVISMTVDNKLTPGDPYVYATAPVITVKNQFSATLLPVTSKLDFNDNMETFKTSGTQLPYTPTNTKSQAALLIVSDESINDKVTLTGANSCDRQLAAGDSLTAKITGNLQGISAVKYEAATTTTYNVTNTDITNGYATLSVTGSNLSICRSTDTPKIYRALELTAANIAGTPIIAGTRTAQITIKGGVGGNIPNGYTRVLVPAGTPSHIIQLDATQYYIPLIKVATGEDTYIKLQSKSTIGGTNGVSIQILASDGSLVTYNAGTITPGTPLTITGSQLVSAVTSAGKTVDGSKGFAAIVTINAPEGDVFAYANICNVSGCKRIPVKTVNGNIVE